MLLRQVTLSEWRIHEPIVNLRSVPCEEVDSKLELVKSLHTEIKVALKVERQWITYFWQVFFVMFLINIATLSSFACNVEDTGDRLAISSTMFLAAVAYQVYVGSLLPKLSYMTFVDLYILGCNILIASVTF